MSGFQLNFDATTVAPDTGFEVVPAGWYNVRIDESEMKPTKDGSGAYLQLRFDILDGQFVGRKLFTRFNLRNSNQQTVEIAYKQLSAVAHAVNVLRVGNSAELHGIPLKVKVKIKTDRTGEYEPSNEITSYKNINEQVDMAGGGAPPVQGGFGGPPQQPTFQQPQQQFQQPNPIQQQGFSGGQSPGFSQPQGQQPWAQAPAAQIAQQAPPQQQGPWTGDGQQQQPQQAQQPPQQQYQQQPPQQQFQQPQGGQPWTQPQENAPWTQAPQQQPQGQPQQAPQQQQPQEQHPAQSAAPPWAQPQG